jgi:hypothetical protein
MYITTKKQHRKTYYYLSWARRVPETHTYRLGRKKFTCKAGVHRECIYLGNEAKLQDLFKDEVAIRRWVTTEAPDFCTPTQGDFKPEMKVFYLCHALTHNDAVPLVVMQTALQAMSRIHARLVGEPAEGTSESSAEFVALTDTLIHGEDA